MGTDVLMVAGSSSPQGVPRGSTAEDSVAVSAPSQVTTVERPRRRQRRWTGRRQARMLAFQVLFGLDLNPHPPEVTIRQRLSEADEVNAEVADHVTVLVDGTWSRLPEIDTRLASAAPAWPLSQMARVDKSILRLAIYELLYCADVPDRVAINEAIELAKVFGHDTSARFVNGVLGTIQAEKEAAATTTGGSEELLKR